MATPADSLATTAQPRELPSPQTGALSADTGVDTLASPNPMGQTIARNVISAGQTNNGDPRDWAENMVAGVQAALAGFGAAGKVPEGAGALYGIGAAQRQIQEQKAEKQKQQMAQKQQLTQEQLAQAQVAHLNAEQYQIERATRNADIETQQKLTDADIQAATPFVDAGVQGYGEHLTSDDLQRMLKKDPATGRSEINGHEVIPFRDGMTKTFGTKGEEIDRPTYRLFDANAEINLDDKNAKLISDNTPFHPVAGQQMKAVDYASLWTQAKRNQAFDLNVQKTQADIGRDKAEQEEIEGRTKDTADLKQIKSDAAKIITPYQQRANGDQLKAFQDLFTHGTQAEIEKVNQAYGPNVIQDWMQNAQNEVDKVKDFHLRETDQMIEKDNLAATKQDAFKEKGIEPINKIWTDPQHGFSGALGQAEVTKAAIQAGKNGKGLLTSLTPTMEILGINHAAGINRISPTEASAAKVPAGWAERWNAWADSASKGKLSPQLAAEGQQLMDIVIQSHHRADVASSQQIASNFGLDPATVYVMDPQGNQVTLKSQIEYYTPKTQAVPQPPGPPAPNMKWQYSPSTKQFRQVPANAQ